MADETGELEATEAANAQMRQRISDTIKLQLAPEGSLPLELTAAQLEILELRELAAASSHAAGYQRCKDILREQESAAARRREKWGWGSPFDEEEPSLDAMINSAEQSLAALQRSDTELDFMDLQQPGTSFSHTCKGGGGKGRWRILSFHWTGTPVSDFVVTTSAGIEFYLVLPERQCLKLVKTIAHAVAWSLYSHVTRLILLATGPQDNVMHGVQIQPSSLVRLPKFEIQLAPPAEPPPSAHRASDRPSGSGVNEQSIGRICRPNRGSSRSRMTCGRSRLTT